MSSYNVRIKTYNDKSRQITTFSRDVKRDFKQKKVMEVSSPATLKEAERREKKNVRDSTTRAKHKIYDLARANSDRFQWFVTLTFDPQRVNSFDYDEVCKKVSNFCDVCRRNCDNLVYIGVPEKHKSGRYHYHFLMGNCENMDFVQSGYMTKAGNEIYNLGNYKWGFSTATRIVDQNRASAYITKYLTKDLCGFLKNRKKYVASRNLKNPKIEYLLENLWEVEPALEQNSTWKKEVDYKIYGYRHKMKIYEVDPSRADEVRL